MTPVVHTGRTSTEAAGAHEADRTSAEGAYFFVAAECVGKDDFNKKANTKKNFNSGVCEKNDRLVACMYTLPPHPPPIQCWV